MADDPCLVRLASLAARICGTPAAFVSLVDLGRTVILAHHHPQPDFTNNVPSALHNVREVPRQASLCAHAIMGKQPYLVVPDAAADDRFASSCPFVTAHDGGLRFYAAACLTTPQGGGDRIGCLGRTIWATQAGVVFSSAPFSGVMMSRKWACER